MQKFRKGKQIFIFLKILFKKLKQEGFMPSPFCPKRTDQKTVNLPLRICKRCKHQWVSGSEFSEKKGKFIPRKPKNCPHCRNDLWDTDK